MSDKMRRVISVFLNDRRVKLHPMRDIENDDIGIGVEANGEIIISVWESNDDHLSSKKLDMARRFIDTLPEYQSPVKGLNMVTGIVDDAADFTKIGGYHMNEFIRLQKENERLWDFVKVAEKAMKNGIFDGKGSDGLLYDALDALKI